LEEVQVAGMGHYGSSLSAVEILVSLYYGFLNVRPTDPNWAERDRLVLSKGHSCSALFPILADLGFFDASHLDTFTRLGSILGDHPDKKKVPGVDFSSGSLGHGLSIAVGMTLAQRLRRINSRIVVIHGDGEQNEGQVWEAAAYAGAHRLSNLLAVMDRNGIQVDGTTHEVLDFEPIEDKWKAFGWRVVHVDGHDLRALRRAYEEYDELRQGAGQPPTMVIAHTVAGKGVDFITGDAAWHVGYLYGADHEEAIRQIRSMYPAREA
jgi:transketolase